MSKNKFNMSRDIAPGDLVFHLLYGKEWIGVFLRAVPAEDTAAASKNRELAVVHMVPGSKYEFFFSKHALRRHRYTDSLGCVSKHWLLKLDNDTKTKN